MSSSVSSSMSRSRSRERSEDEIQLPHNAKPISESDYFQKSDEFRVWLKDEKGKYFDELSGDRARSYFRKFVKYWNRGKLSKSLYAGVDISTIPSQAQTGYKWSFASKASRADDEALKRARASVSAATRLRDIEEPFDSPSTSRGSSRMQGPTLPSAADMQLARELTTETREEERNLKRKREKKEDKDRIEDMVGPREVGREGMLEKKRAKRDSDRTFRDKGDEGLEADESTLMGGGDSFKQQVARRDAARQRNQQEKANTIRERVSVFKEKEDATMAMFQKLAKERFG